MGKKQKMKGYIFFIFTTSSAFAKCSSEESGEWDKMETGLCLENDEVMSMCIGSIMDTEIGMKIGDAMFSCSDVPTEMRNGKGKGKKGKGKRKSCPSVEDIANMAIEELSAEELCVFQTLGWLDDSYNFDDEAALSDIMSLPESFSEVLTVDNIIQCAEDLLSEMAEDPEMSKCWDKYSEQEQTQLEEIGTLYAGVSCFTRTFQETCNQKVKEQLMNMWFSQMDAGK